ncbi:collagen alpha-2(I) chain-like isoform X2 [Anguilla anguilla]|uniref:collagen alpha-2(I) chain-like isoform X2 n=1 Tax=Anguilla anguilla TaxID=7936 RepID=UPI0015A85EF2|nr:collagen alpha-2(I) chain-like isoform X2 [Anguilla anguilla]XP_035239888.1 collagen alpha-2(I) chain-like isoform X2 [Anguilla anguilla]
MLPYFLDNADPPVGIIGPRLAFEDDRHVLAEERKACRARARKLSVENNRRRKAQEERRQAVELREQKLREEILQERRRKLLEATEQHQRAHLPPSQRRRPVTGRPAHLLDNALRRIEGTFSWCGLQSPFYPGSPSTFRRCHSSSNASAVSSKLHQQRQLSAAIAHVKLLQGKGTNEPQSRDLCFYNKLREKQHPLAEGQWNSKQENPQDVRQPGQTETLPGLETEISPHSPSHSTGPSHFTGHSHMSSHSHTTCPSHKYGLSHTSGHAQTSSHSHTTCHSHIYSLSYTSGYAQTSSHSHAAGPSHTPGPSHAAAVRSAFSSWLRPSLLLSSCQSHGPLERSHGARSASAMSGESVGLARQEVVNLSFLSAESQRTEEPRAAGEPGYEGPPARAGPGGEEPQSQPDVTVSAAPPVPSDRNTPTQSGTAAILDHQTPSSTANQLRGLSGTVPLAVTRGAWAGPDAPPTELSGPTGGGKAAESVQRTGNGADRYSSRASVALPIREQSRGTGSGRPITAPAASLRTVNQSISTPEAPFMANAEPRPTGRISTVDVNSDSALNKDADRACPDSSDPSDQINASDRTEEGVPTGAPYRETFRHPSADSASDPVSDVKSLRGILKKQSKYAAGLSGPSRACGSFDFPKAAAAPVRHAAERAEPGGRAPESVERRLRWSDEERGNLAADGGVEGGWRCAAGQTGGKGTSPQLHPNSAELQRGPLCAGRVSSTGYHFAKRAWSDSGDRDRGGRDGAPQERRLGKSSPPRGGSRAPRAPRRAGSAPAGPRPGPSRRGAGVRPRSAAGRGEAGQRGAKTLSPHPPAPCRTKVT